MKFLKEYITKHDVALADDNFECFCPHCKHKEIECTSDYWDGNRYELYYVCKKCHRTWRDIYKLERVETDE